MEKHEKRQVEVPPAGSLGILALGHLGLDLWREARAKSKEQKNEQEETNNDKDEGE